MVKARRKSLVVFVSTFILVLLSVPHVPLARVEWKAIGQIDLPEKPLDVATDLDGNNLFILVPGKILIYSVARQRVTRIIPYEGRFDRLISSWRSSRLILFDSSKRTVKVIEPEIIHKLDYSGLPFIGPSHAPVTIAVFSDYQ